MKWKILSISLLSLSALLWLPMTTNAAEFPTSTSPDQITGEYCGGNYQGIFQPLMSGLTGILDEDNGVKFKGSFNSSTDVAVLWAFPDSGGTPTISETNAITITELSGGYYVAYWDNITLNPSYYYQVGFKRNAGNYGMCIAHVDTGDISYTFQGNTGDVTYYYNGNWYMNQPNLYLEFGTPSLVQSITISAPLENSIIYSNAFKQWAVDVTGINPTSSYKVLINWGYSSSSLEFSNSQIYNPVFNGTVCGVGNTDCTFMLNANVPAVFDGSDTVDIYAKAYLVEGLSPPQSSVIHFQLRKSEVGLELLNTSSSVQMKDWAGNIITSDPENNDNPFYVDCSEYDDVPFFSSGTIPGITCSIQKGFGALASVMLIPPDYSYAFLSSSTKNLTSQFPLNIAFDFSNEMLNWQERGIESKSLNLNITGIEQNIPLLNTSTLSAVFGQEFKDTVFEVQEKAFYIAGLLFILTMIL